ncbi:DUF2185 domain-containing protein [Mucilaginibacter myungsuensis]|uniref:DUF2185 domain-containing protein n=1 Tax=Mucilaginibacter myungsuensis TaxID=649104 RepID=A0A929PZC0_9SPHI|nr:DUF2185 domain-containing protein [Mucilaginibacter myungsuensis]MBE9664340.1 DUF2185 domain-containing protein [Mucilaginibacter myungsuensis]MDN3597050.1 DUF2185 domain-containing protein [Mucilaginibacter myungsuensis]
MTTKKFKLDKEEIKQLIKPIGGCFATDKITVNGEQVGYMYREEPEDDERSWHSGWFFNSGTEDQEYIDNPDNIMIYDVNTIANYDSVIIPYLQLPYGTQLERIRGTDEFILIEE